MENEHLERHLRAIAEGQATQLALTRHLHEVLDRHGGVLARILERIEQVSTTISTLDTSVDNLTAASGRLDTTLRDMGDGVTRSITANGVLIADLKGEIQTLKDTIGSGGDTTATVARLDAITATLDTENASVATAAAALAASLPDATTPPVVTPVPSPFPSTGTVAVGTPGVLLAGNLPSGTLTSNPPGNSITGQRSDDPTNPTVRPTPFSDGIPATPVTRPPNTY